jgi:hypothetical protein
MKEIIKNERAKITDYRRAVLASIVLKLHIEDEWNLEYDFYYGAYLENEEGEATPDVFLDSENQTDILGDIKRSLPNPPERSDSMSLTEYTESEPVERWLQNKMHPDITEKVRKYDENFDNCDNDHDTFLLYSDRYSESLNMWKKKVDLELKGNLVGLSYHASPMSNGDKTMNISIEMGEFQDEELNQHFDLEGCSWNYAEAPELINQYKIAVVDEGHQVPMEYVMLVLWQNIFEELRSENTEERILENLKKFDAGDSVVIETNLETIVDHLHEFYTLSYYDTREHSQDERKQFTKDVVKDAMNRFEQIDLTDVKKIENGTKFRIVYEELSKGRQDALESLIEALDEKNLLKERKGEKEKQSNVLNYLSKA